MSSQEKLDIQWLKLDDIHPYPNNPRRIEPEHVQAVANSIQSFGWKQVIVVDSDHVIIVGHTRLEAARMLSLDRAPVHVWADCTEEQANAYRLADNRSGELTEWDIPKLREELKGLDSLFDHMTDFGFSEMELEMAKIDDLAVATGQEPEPWENDPEGYISKKQETPRCIVYFGTEEAQEGFFDWLKTQDANFNKHGGSGAPTWVAYMPERERERYNKEEDEE